MRGSLEAEMDDKKKKAKRLWLAVAVLVLLSPLGLLLPELMDSEGTWGEWGAEGLREAAGYVPDGYRRLSELWKSPVPDYGRKQAADATAGLAAYVLSAAIGVAMVGAGAYALGRLLAKKDGDK